MIANKLIACPPLIYMQCFHAVWCVDVDGLADLQTCVIHVGSSSDTIWYHSFVHTDIVHAWLDGRLQHINSTTKRLVRTPHKNISKCGFNTLYRPNKGWSVPTAGWFEGCYLWYNTITMNINTSWRSISLSISFSIAIRLLSIGQQFWA